MIRPAITPRRVTGNATTGIVTAARSGVRNIQRSTNTISKAPDVTKEQRFGMNYVQFFGSKKTFKVLEKSMKTIRDSMVSTFAMAKELKDSVTKGEGVFGFVGKIIGLAAGAIGLFSILGAPIIKTLLASIALGGIGSVLFAFKDQIIDFFKDKASGFKLAISEIVDDILIDRFQSGEYREIEKVSESNIDQRIKELTTRKKEPLNLQNATVQATQEEISTLKDQLAILKTKRGKTNSDKRTIDAIKSRIKFLETGEMSLPMREVKGPLDFKAFAANAFRKFLEPNLADESVYTGKNYLELSSEDKLRAIESSLKEFGMREDIGKAKLFYSRDLNDKNIKESDRRQALDTLRYLDMVDGNALGGIEGEKKDDFLNRLSSITANPKKLSKNVSSMSNDQTIAAGGGGGGNNVQVLPMNNQKNNTLARNDTGGLTSGSSMKLFDNFDHDNFKALFNQADLNIV